MSEKKLTARQQKFAEAYLQTLNKTEAAKLAGHKGTHGSLRTKGYETYAKPHVKAYIEKRLAEWSIPTNELIHRVTEIATGNIAEFLDEHGGVNQDVVKTQGHLIRKYKITHANTTNADGSPEWSTTELELYPADDALKQLMRMYGLDKQKFEVSGADGGALIFKVEYADSNNSST